MPNEKFIMSFSARDRELLKLTAEAAGVSYTQALRWAVRFYFLHGPWTTKNATERRQQLGVSDDLEIGRLLSGV